MVGKSLMSSGFSKKPTRNNYSEEEIKDGDVYDATTDAKTNGKSSTDVSLELRDSINSSLLNVGVLAALMMALAGAIYIDPPEEGLCFGDVLLKTEMVVVWLSMGCFFFSTIGALVLYMDLEGVPTDLLLVHISNGVTKLIYCLPHIATAIGIFLTAIGYGIDIGERGGCPFLIFGLIAAPMFVLLIVALWWFTRRRRQRLFRKHNDDSDAEVSLFATWTDRITIFTDIA